MNMETFRKLFGKTDRQQTADSMFLEIPDEIMKVFNEVTIFLGIKGLNIRIVPYIYNSPTIYAMGISSMPVEGVLVEEYCKGSFIESENTIYLARYALVDDMHSLMFDDKDIIESMLHEIRHVWQKQYHEDIYYAGSNAISNEEHMDDISEIDADAFALAYTLCVLGYENEDLSFDMGYKYMNDGGKRKQRVCEIVEEYGLLD